MGYESQQWYVVAAKTNTYTSTDEEVKPQTCVACSFKAASDASAPPPPTQGPEPLVWKNLKECEQSDNGKIVKIGGGNHWNGAADSTVRLNGDFEVNFTCTGSGQQYTMLGLSAELITTTVYTYQRIACAAYCAAGHAISGYESGVKKEHLGGYSGSSSRFQWKREGNALTLWMDDSQQWTCGTKIDGPVYAQV